MFLEMGKSTLLTISQVMLEMCFLTQRFLLTGLLLNKYAGHYDQRLQSAEACCTRCRGRGYC